MYSKDVIYTKLKHKLKWLNIDKYKKYGKLILRNYNYKCNSLQHIMNGGNKQYEKIIKYGDVDFVFKLDKDKYNYMFSLHQMNNKEKPKCIHIMIDINDKMAYIQELSNDDLCFNNNQKKEFGKNATGSLLLKISIKLIEKIKDIYGLKYVQLKDNAQKFCGNKRINLSNMYMLLYGDTWYGDYGFIPIKENDFKKYENTNILLDYHRNKTLSSTILLNDVKNLKKYIEYSLKKHNRNKFIDKFNEFIDNNQTMKLSTFLLKFLENYDNNCYLFIDFYDKIIKDIGMKKFDQSVYIYPIDKQYVMNKFYLNKSR